MRTLESRTIIPTILLAVAWLTVVPQAAKALDLTAFRQCIGPYGSGTECTLDYNPAAIAFPRPF